MYLTLLQNINWKYFSLALCTYVYFLLLYSLDSQHHIYYIHSSQRSHQEWYILCITLTFLYIIYFQCATKYIYIYTKLPNMLFIDSFPKTFIISKAFSRFSSVVEVNSIARKVLFTLYRKISIFLHIFFVIIFLIGTASRTFITLIGK